MCDISVLIATPHLLFVYQFILFRFCVGYFKPYAVGGIKRHPRYV